MLKHVYGGDNKKHRIAASKKSSVLVPGNTDMVVAVENCANPNPTLLGGKGLRLVELANRFPVPDAIVVPTTICFEHHKNAGILNGLSKQLRSGSTAVAQARQATLKIQIQNDLVQAIEAFITRIQQKTGRQCAFAVRSSASV